MSLGPMRPLLVFSRVVGLNPTGGPPSFKSRVAKFPLFLSFCTMTFSGVKIPIEVLKIARDYSYRGSHFGSILHINCMGVVLIGHMGITMGTFRKTKYLPKVLQECNNLPGPRKDRWATALHTTQVVCMITIGLSLRILCSFVGNEVLSNVCDSVVTLLVLTTTDRILFFHLVRHIGTSFKRINARLAVIQEVAASKNQASSSTKDSQYTADYLTPICNELCKLMAAHGKACDMLDNLTLTQEVQLLATLIVEFVLIVVYFYVVSFTLYYKLYTMMHIIAFGSIFIFWLFLTQCAVVVACRSTCSKGNETLNIIHDMINSSNFTDAETKKLVLFSMQIGHREVAVVPHGLFAVDISLLKSLFTTVLMYVVILVQFGTPGYY